MPRPAAAGTMATPARGSGADATSHPAVKTYTLPPFRPCMEETRRTAAKLVGQFMDGDIQLPEMQRSYAWTKEKVRALVDSIYKGYPSGSILLWETDARVPTHSPAAADANRGPGEPLVELAVEYEVGDIRRHVVRVERRLVSKTIETHWERWGRPA